MVSGKHRLKIGSVGKGFSPQVIRWCYNDQILASVHGNQNGEKQLLIFTNVRTKARLEKIEINGNEITDLVWLPKQQQLVTLERAGIVKFWDISSLLPKSLQPKPEEESLVLQNLNPLEVDINEISIGTNAEEEEPENTRVVSEESPEVEADSGELENISPTDVQIDEFLIGTSSDNKFEEDPLSETLPEEPIETVENFVINEPLDKELLQNSLNQSTSDLIPGDPTNMVVESGVEEESISEPFESKEEPVVLEASAEIPATFEGSTEVQPEEEIIDFDEPGSVGEPELVEGELEETIAENNGQLPQNESNGEFIEETIESGEKEEEAFMENQPETEVVHVVQEETPPYSNVGAEEEFTEVEEPDYEEIEQDQTLNEEIYPGEITASEVAVVNENSLTELLLNREFFQAERAAFNLLYENASDYDARVYLTIAYLFQGKFGKAKLTWYNARNETLTSGQDFTSVLIANLDFLMDNNVRHRDARKFKSLIQD